MGIFDSDVADAIRDWFSRDKKEDIKNDNGYNKIYSGATDIRARDIIKEGNLVNGVRDGLWKYYENDYREENCKKGKTIYIKLFHSKGKIKCEGGINEEGKELWKITSRPQLRTYSGGNPHYVGNTKYIINDECKIGVWKYYDELGNLTEKDYGENKPIVKEDLPTKESNPTISSEANIGVNQKLPYWFTNNIGQTDYGMEDVKTYDNGDIVINWEGKEIELNNIELTMYHYLMGAKKILENGMDEKVWSTYKRGIDWFRKNNPKAYMELFD